jgi:hypothetical protein
MHLVGHLYEDYLDTRSLERKNLELSIKGRHAHYGVKNFHDDRDTRYESRKLRSVVSTTNIVQGLLAVYRELR